MTDDGTLLRGMRKVGELGGVVCVHAENNTLIQELVDRFRGEGRKDVRAFIDSHPEYSELEAVHRLLFLAEQATECAVHVCHVSVASGARLIREARGRDVTNVTCETCPQYLGLTEDDLVRDDTLFVVRDLLAGLDPCPCGDTEELFALNREIAAEGGIFVVRQRDEGYYLSRSFDEVARISMESGAHLEISHWQAH
jgi:hypothetical protein